MSDSNKFTPFHGMGSFELVPPIRKNVRAISKIMYETNDGSIQDRIAYGKAAGLDIKEDATEAPNTYTEHEAREKLALALFDIKEDEVDDFDLLNEGEIARAVKFFFLSRNGIY